MFVVHVHVRVKPEYVEDFREIGPFVPGRIELIMKQGEARDG